MPKLSKHVSAAVKSAAKYAVDSSAKLVGGTHLLHGALSVKECSLIKALAAVGMRNGEWRLADSEPVQEISQSQERVELERLNDPERETFTRDSTAGANEQQDAIAMEPDNVTVDEATGAYRTTYPAFEGDLVGFDQQSFRGRLQDSLGADVYAAHLAQLISARKTPLPLSVGLFGDWGAGKSFFMRLLHQRIDELASQNNDAFSRKVVQIHFNAWHYLDTNLWANLVCEIFENLFASLERKPDVQEKIDRLKKKLAEGSALVAEAKKELTAATRARENAQEQWLRAAQARKLTEASIRSYFDDLSNIVLSDPDTEDTLKSLSLSLGLPRLEESFADLEANVTEARGLAGRLRTLVLGVLSPQGLYRRLSLLLVALIAPAAVAWLLGITNANLSTVTRTIITFTTFIGTVSAWISEQTKRGSVLIGKLETAYARVKALREQKLAGNEGSEKQRDLNKCNKDEEAADEKLRESQARVRAIETELQELTPGRRLLRFLEQRTGSDDYRQYLGLVSLVRRDFEQLSRLLIEGFEKRENNVDRIVLYIDDLDRCSSDRVVAVLEAVHLLLAFPVFAVVVAVDPRWLRSSLIEHYPVLLSPEQASQSLLYDENLERMACPQDYLEKIFQIPFQIQSIDKDGFANLVNDLLNIAQESTLGATEPIADVLPPETVLPVRIATEDTTSESPSTLDGPSAKMTPMPIQATPERLQLEKWERLAINECHPLFRTPRAVKRLVNTYCLIRVGVSEREWGQFLGSENRPKAEYRTPLLMMAVGAAYPSLASLWLDLVRRDGSWTPDLAKLSGNGNQAGKGLKDAEWRRLNEALTQITVNEFAPFDRALVETWAAKARRYFF